MVVKINKLRQTLRTWCRFSRSPLPFFHFVWLFSKRNLLRCDFSRLPQFFFFSVLSTSRDLPLSSLFRLNPLYFSKLPFLSQQNSEYPHLQINVMPFKTSPYLSRNSDSFSQPEIVLSILPMSASPRPKNHLSFLQSCGCTFPIFLERKLILRLHYGLKKNIFLSFHPGPLFPFFIFFTNVD